MVKLRVDTRLDRFHVVFRKQQKIRGDTVIILVAEQFDAFLVRNLDVEIVHWILLRIVFMSDWFLQHGVELAAFVFTLVVTIVGWILEHRSSKERNKDREEDIRLLRERIDASNAAVAALRDQVHALESQADALQRQAAIQEDEASVPKWELRQVHDLKHSVANNNPFDARDVRSSFRMAGSTSSATFRVVPKRASCSANVECGPVLTMMCILLGRFRMIRPIVSS